jgi:hypothetical protein
MTRAGQQAPRRLRSRARARGSSSASHLLPVGRDAGGRSSGRRPCPFGRGRVRAGCISSGLPVARWSTNRAHEARPGRRSFPDLGKERGRLRSPRRDVGALRPGPHVVAFGQPGRLHLRRGNRRLPACSLGLSETQRRGGRAVRTDPDRGADQGLPGRECRREQAGFGRRQRRGSTCLSPPSSRRALRRSGRFT